MSERRRYSARTKAKAVGIAVVDGVTDAERQTGIPKQTIDYWLRQDDRFGQLRTRAREEVAEDFWVGIQIGLDEVTKGLRDAGTPLRDKAAALHELGDRFALLTGAATSRTERRDLTDNLDDGEKEALADAIDEWLKRKPKHTAEERM